MSFFKWNTSEDTKTSEPQKTAEDTIEDSATDELQLADDNKNDTEIFDAIEKSDNSTLEDEFQTRSEEFVELCEPNTGNITDLDSKPETVLDEWIDLNPTYREPEVDFLERLGTGYAITVDNSGCLQLPMSVDGWVVLLVLDRRFPKLAEDGTPSGKVYFVSPSAEEIAAMPGFQQSFADTDQSGNVYLAIRNFDKRLKSYLSGRSDQLISEILLAAITDFRAKFRGPVRKSSGRQEPWNRPTITGSKYIDTRKSTRGSTKNPKCNKVVLSDRAIIQIYNETQARIRTETGGLLLGHFENGVWYVVEASDPGWQATFQTSFHEADENYENHVCSVISRTYKHPLAFLGMWHRHPGSLDTFSGTDDETNSKYVDSCGNGCISALVNYDPDFRITFYYVERANNGGVVYSQVDVEVGDECFVNPEMMRIASIDDSNRRIAGDRNLDTYRETSRNRSRFGCRRNDTGPIKTDPLWRLFR